MSNPGIAPADPTTAIGTLRYLIGDITYQPLSPPVTGQGDYVNFSDAQLQTFLNLGSDNLGRAAGFSYLTLAASFAADAIKFTSDDLSADLMGRADAMRKLAQEWFDRADSQDEIDAAEYFNIVSPFAADDRLTHRGELGQWPWAWGYPGEWLP